MKLEEICGTYSVTGFHQSEKRNEEKKQETSLTKMQVFMTQQKHKMARYLVRYVHKDYRLQVIQYRENSLALHNYYAAIRVQPRVGGDRKRKRRESRYLALKV